MVITGVLIASLLICSLSVISSLHLSQQTASNVNMYHTTHVHISEMFQFKNQFNVNLRWTTGRVNSLRVSQVELM